MQPDHRGWTATHSLDSFDCTLANLREVVFACLEAAGARSVAEIGAEHGLFTSELLAWSESNGGGSIAAIDPAPRKRLQELAERHTELELIVETSHDALPRLDLPDAVILDGDHNYFTVHEELLAIDRKADGRPLPLVLLHDIGWPLGRRDTYHDPNRIPAEHRRPFSQDGFLVPGDPGLAERGLYYERIAAEEGGPGNGVLTAVEDFVAERPHLRLAIAAPFFGLGVLWDERAEWASGVAATVAPWDRNPLLERMESKRVFHLVAEFGNLQRVDALRTADYVHRYRLIGRLLPLLGSRAFALAEWISTIKQGGQPNVSRADLAALVDDLAADDIDVERMRTNPEPSPPNYVVRAVEPPVPAPPRPGPPPGASDLASETS
jgi:hypothetical protein